MSDEQRQVKELDSLFRKTLEHQSRANQFLDKVAAELQSGEELDEEDAHRMLRLVLQYRLDTIDSIKKLLHMNKALCHAIGIDENNSMKKNLDLAAFQLGEDNLLRELTLLSGLWRELNKALAMTEKGLRLQAEEKKRHQKILDKVAERAGLSKDKKEASKTSKKMTRREREMLYSVKDALGHSEYFKLNLEQLTEAYHHFGGLPKFGLIYDYLAGLKGPISQFHTALQHGIGQSQSLVKALSNQLNLSNDKLTVSRLVHDLNNSLSKHISQQKQLLQTEQNQKAHWRQLNHQLDPNAHPKPKPEAEPSQRFSHAMSLRRTLNIFNR